MIQVQGSLTDDKTHASLFIRLPAVPVDCNHRAGTLGDPQGVHLPVRVKSPVHGRSHGPDLGGV